MREAHNTCYLPPVVPVARNCNACMPVTRTEVHRENALQAVGCFSRGGRPHCLLCLVVSAPWDACHVRLADLSASL